MLGGDLSVIPLPPLRYSSAFTRGANTAAVLYAFAMSSRVSPARIRVHAIKNLALQSSRSLPLPLSSASDGRSYMLQPHHHPNAGGFHDPAYRQCRARTR